MSENLQPENEASGEPEPTDVPPVPQPPPVAHSPGARVPGADTTTTGEQSVPGFAGGGELPPGYPPGGPGYWGYPPGGPGWGGPGWGGPPWGPPAWGPPAAAGPSRRRWYLRPISVAALIVATVGAGVGIGQAVWSTGASTPASASAPGSSSGGSANPFSGSSSGTNPGGAGSLGGGSGSSSGTGSSSGPSDVHSIAAKVDPALVDINVTLDGEPAAGTGIVLTASGEILTNNHVVEGATSISVVDLGNRKTYGATVVGYDRTDDVAVIQLTHASGLQTAKIANSSKVTVGEDVVAIGNAGGTGGTPTAAGGSITAVDQAITASDPGTGSSENLTGLFETNADIQPGDSGGSLVNKSGQVVGMDTAASEGYSLSSQTTQGYSIPINTALSIASQIESGSGSSSVHVGPTAYLGVLISSSQPSTSPYPGGSYNPYGGQNGGSSTTGADVAGVVNGGPAAKAGLAEGDVITSLDGHAISSASDLSSLIVSYKPGDRVQVGWTDTSGTSHTTTITLGTGPAQ
jgi:S1-C subfamily serine protease